MHAWLALSLLLLSLEITRIHDVIQFIILLLQRPRRSESHQQIDATRFIIGAAGSRPAKRLLPNHGPGGLAIDVKIAGRPAKAVLGLSDRNLVICEDGSREREAASLSVDDVEDVVELGVGVDVGHEHGAEEFLLEEGVIGSFGDVKGGVDVEAFAPVVGASDRPLKLTVFVGGVDRLGDLIESRLIDHRAEEVLKILWRADLDGLELVLHRVEESGGLTLWEIDPRASRALLPGVLERSADGVSSRVFNVRGRMDQVEILSRRLAHHSGEIAVSVADNALGCLLVKRSKYAR